MGQPTTSSGYAKLKCCGVLRGAVGVLRWRLANMKVQKQTHCEHREQWS
jgi:hypothetical protein